MGAASRTSVWADDRTEVDEERFIEAWDSFNPTEAVWRMFCGLRLRGSRAKRLLHSPGSTATGFVWAPFCGFAHCVSAEPQSTKQLHSGQRDSTDARQRNASAAGGRDGGDDARARCLRATCTADVQGNPRRGQRIERPDVQPQPPLLRPDPGLLHLEA